MVAMLHFDLSLDLQSFLTKVFLDASQLKSLLNSSLLSPIFFPQRKTLRFLFVVRKLRVMI